MERKGNEEGRQGRDESLKEEWNMEREESEEGRADSTGGRGKEGSQGSTGTSEPNSNRDVPLTAPWIQLQISPSHKFSSLPPSCASSSRVFPRLRKKMT